MSATRKTSSERRRPGAVSIRDIATRAGVSIATVSRAVNGISTVNPELARKVWQAIEEVGYLPNTQARALVSGRSHTLGLIVSEITNPFFPELVQEFEYLAVAQGYEVLIGSTNYEPARTESLMRRVLQRNVDGVAVMTFGVEEQLVKKLVEREFPLVFVDAGPDLPNIRVLKVDYGEGIRQAVQHLAALGHRNIAFISGPLSQRSPTARRDAFLKSMGELGLIVPPEHLVEGNHAMEGGIGAMERLRSGVPASPRPCSPPIPTTPRSAPLPCRSRCPAATRAWPPTSPPSRAAGVRQMSLRLRTSLLSPHSPCNSVPRIRTGAITLRWSAWSAAHTRPAPARPR